MKTAYYDAAFLCKLIFPEAGSEKVVIHANQMHHLFCSMHGRAEFVATCHRKMREGSATKLQVEEAMQQIHQDTKFGFMKWLPLTEKHLARVEVAFRHAPKDLFLRASDALHLAVAAEHGLKEIFSNDRHLLNAASLFGLKGKNLLA
ncbi:MAG: type II toxin-antitoxin system VapC family toxin [Chthoniobacterales bacterium]|nr:type II toxin-antitoxin system VapC family toxin [Chthoniobacterales bacterium]